MNKLQIHANNYDRVADIYDATRGLSPEVEREVGDGLAAILTEHGARSVFEVGVGTGRVAVLLAERGFSITGIDISRAMLRILLAKRTDIRVLLAEASRPPFRPGSFDATIFSHVLHLVPDPRATIFAAIACLRPGGLLINCQHTYGEYPEQRAGERLNEIILEVTGLPGRSHSQRTDTAPVLRDVLEDLRVPMETRELAHWVDRTTARREIARLESRANSNTWAISDAQMPEVVRRFTAEATEIFGGFDQESRARASFEVNIARLSV